MALPDKRAAPRPPKPAAKKAAKKARTNPLLVEKTPGSACAKTRISRIGRLCALLALALAGCRPSAPAGPPGARDKDEIRAVVRANLHTVRECYNRGLGRDPKLTGRVAVQFRIEATGAVADAFVQSSTLPLWASHVAHCIVRAARRWQFPPAGGWVLISYPFVLEPGDD